jgi:hypothetical protein
MRPPRPPRSLKSTDLSFEYVLRHERPAVRIGHVRRARLVDREELVAMLFAIADLNAKVGRILQLLEEEFGGGEALPEDDA